MVSGSEAKARSSPDRPPDCCRDRTRVGLVCNAMCDTMFYMATRLNQPTERRTALPLTARDVADLAKLREPGPEREALADLAASLPAGDVSESLLVHAVFQVGLRAVREAAEERSYAEAAFEQQLHADADRAAARRRRPSWAD